MFQFERFLYAPLFLCSSVRDAPYLLWATAALLTDPRCAKLSSLTLVNHCHSVFSDFATCWETLESSAPIDDERAALR